MLKKKVTRPASLSLLNPVTALRSLLSVALSSVTAKSIFMIPSIFISCQRTSTPTRVYSLERRRCSVYSDDTVQFQTAQVFIDTAIFSLFIRVLGSKNEKGGYFISFGFWCDTAEIWKF